MWPFKNKSTLKEDEIERKEREEIEWAIKEKKRKEMIDEIYSQTISDCDNNYYINFNCDTKNILQVFDKEIIINDIIDSYFTCTKNYAKARIIEIEKIPYKLHQVVSYPQWLLHGSDYNYCKDEWCNKSEDIYYVSDKVSKIIVTFEYSYNIGITGKIELGYFNSKIDNGNYVKNYSFIQSVPREKNDKFQPCYINNDIVDEIERRLIEIMDKQSSV